MVVTCMRYNVSSEITGICCFISARGTFVQLILALPECLTMSPSRSMLQATGELSGGILTPVF